MGEKAERQSHQSHALWVGRLCLMLASLWWVSCAGTSDGAGPESGPAEPSSQGGSRSDGGADIEGGGDASGATDGSVEAPNSSDASGDAGGVGEAGVGGNASSAGGAGAGGGAGENSSGGADAGEAGDANQPSDAFKPKRRDLEDHRANCPGASPQVGTPLPDKNAEPVRHGDAYESVPDPLAKPEAFGLSNNLRVEETVQNWGFDLTFREPAWGLYDYSLDPDFEFPEWLSYRHADASKGGGGTHEFTVAASSPLERGTYHFTVHLKGESTEPFGTDRTDTLDFILRVRGLEFLAPLLVSTHHPGDSLQKPMWLALAGGDNPWRITDIPPWLELEITAGETVGQLELVPSKNSALTALELGHYSARICVENDRGDFDSIPVFALIERSRLRPLHRQRILYSLASTEQLTTYNYLFTDQSEETEWVGKSDQPWLKFGSPTGQTNERFELSVDAVALPDGLHEALLEFTDPSGRSDPAYVTVHFLKKPQLSSWLLSEQIFSPSSFRSATGPYRYLLQPDGVIFQNVLTGGGRSVPAPVGESLAFGAFSEDGKRLYMVSRTDEPLIERTLLTYSWPELNQLDSAPAGSFAGRGQVVETSFGKEYITGLGLYNITDARSGRGFGGRRQPEYQSRRRIYDDGVNLFYFSDILARKKPQGIVHYARSPQAMCNWRESIFICEDESGTYLTATTPLATPAPFFTHDGGVYFHAGGERNHLTIVNAAGEQVPVHGMRGQTAPDADQWGDTLLVDAGGGIDGDGWGRALNDLFQPAPPQPMPAAKPASGVCPATPGTAFKTHVLFAKDLIANPQRDLLYATIDSLSSAENHSLVTINGSSGEIQSSIPIPREASVMAISDDGTKLSLGADASGLLRVDVSALVPVLGDQVPIPTIGRFEPIVENVVALPGAIDAVVATLDNFGHALFIDGVLRDVTERPVADFLVAGPAGYVFGHGSHASTSYLGHTRGRHLVFERYEAELGQVMSYEEGYLFADGRAFDVAELNVPRSLGSLTAAGPQLPDVTKRRVWTLTQGVDGQAQQLAESSLDSLQQLSSTPVTGVELGKPRDFVRAISGCMAYIKKTGIQTSIVMVSPPN